MEVPRLGVKLKLQLPAYATATAVQGPSCICDLYYRSQQPHILNPLSKPRDQTCILWTLFRFLICSATTGAPNIFFFFWPCPQHAEIPGPGIKPTLQQWQHWSLTTRPPGNSAVNFHLYNRILVLDKRDKRKVMFLRSEDRDNSLVEQHVLCNRNERMILQGGVKHPQFSMKGPHTDQHVGLFKGTLLQHRWVLEFR